MTDLPRGWAEATLDDLFLTVLGGDWGKDPNENLADSCLVRCIRASELRKWSDEYGKSAAIRRLKFSSLEKRRLQEGDILVEVSGGGPDQAVGRTVLITNTVLKNDPERDYVCTNFFRFCRPSREVQAKFLNWYLTYFYRSGGTEELQGGSNNLRNLRFPDFVAQTVPIPPLNEQRRIVEKIEAMFDEIDKGVESLQTARTTLGLYRQSLLKSAYQGRLTADWRAQNADKLEAPETLLARIQHERDTRYKTALDAWQDALAEWRADGEKGKKPAKPKRPDDVSAVDESEAREVGDVPNDWAWVRPSLIAEPSPHAIGIGPFGSNLKVSDYREDGVPLVFVRNITQEDFTLSKKFVSPEKAAELDAHSIQAGDVLVTKMGDPPGDCTVYPDNGPYAIITADCLKFRVWEQFADRRFVSFMIRSNAVKRQLGLITQGVAQKKISVARFKTIALPLPSIAEQAEIVRRLDARLEAADALEAEIDAALTRADALRQSILKKAFSGQLVPQDPDDEPASALLERIKADRAQSPKNTRKKASA